MGVAEGGSTGPFVDLGEGESEVPLGGDEVGGGRLELMELVALCGAAAGTQEMGPGPVGLAGPAGAQVGVEAAGVGAVVPDSARWTAPREMLAASASTRWGSRVARRSAIRC